MAFLPQGFTKYLPDYVCTHPKAAVGIGAATAALVLLALAARATPPIERVPKQEKLVQAAVEPAHTLQSQVGALISQVKTQEETMATVTKFLAKMERGTAEVEQARKKDQEEFRTHLQTMQQKHEGELERLRKSSEKTTVVKTGTAPAPKMPSMPAAPPTPQFQLRTIGSSKDATRPTLPPLVHHTPTVFLPAGCFAKIRLVTGTAATSDTGNNGFGHPMLFSITDPFECARRLDEIGLVSLRHRTGVPLDGCLGFAHGKADLSNSRVQGQGSLLSCVMPDGESYEVPIKGYLVDQDGTQGLWCEIETHDSAKIGKAFLAGLVNEATAIFSSARKGVTINAVGQAGGYGGMENTLNQVANYWLQQARALAPTCHAPSGSWGYLVIQQGVPLDGLPMVNFLTTGTL